MLKLLVYGYSYGIRSSRKLERVCHHNLSFVWLTSNLKPDPKTIAEFRRKNKEALAQVLKQCTKICIKLNLIEGNTLFLDGTKIRANASIDKTWTKEKAKKALKHIDERISDILAQCDAIDEAEQGSLVTIDEELKDHIALLTLFKTYQGTNRAQITALVGFDSTKRESGSSVRGKAKISKNGKGIYRKVSYLPAICATVHNQKIRVFYQRLLANHKPKKLAIIASMRKILLIAHAMYRDKTEYVAA